MASLVPAEGIDLMLDFYRDERAEGGCLDDEGDMLLYQWGTDDWGEGEFFELDITRQFITGDEEDDNIRQLSLTFKFPPDKELRRLAEGNRWCQTPDELKKFRAFVAKTPAYKAVGQHKPAKVELDFERV